MSDTSEYAPPDPPAVVRTSLLTAEFAQSRTIGRVEVKHIRLGRNQASGPHVHPCPVIGLIIDGAVLFQVEDDEPQILRPGAAFYEPADVRIAHFDARESGATFVASYLLSPGETELIRILPDEDGTSPSP